MKHNSFFIILIVVLLVGCDFNFHKPDKRLKITNNSSTPIYLTITGGGELTPPVIDDVSPWSCSVLIPPFSSSIVTPPSKLGMNTTWEAYLHWCYGKRAGFFILDADKITDISNKQQIIENTLQVYNVSLQNIINLNWEISHPTTEAMKDINMYPPYGEVSDSAK